MCGLVIYTQVGLAVGFCYFGGRYGDVVDVLFFFDLLEFLEFWVFYQLFFLYFLCNSVLYFRLLLEMYILLCMIFEKE